MAWRRAFSIGSGLLTVAVLGCVSDGKSTGGSSGDRTSQRTTDVQRLRGRAEALWSARREENWDRAFDFENPDERKNWDRAQFVDWSEKNYPFRVLSYEIGSVQVDGDLGWTEVNYQSLVRRFPDVPARSATQWQKWHRLDGGWFPIHPRDLDKFPEPPSRRDAAEEARLRQRFMESFECRKNRDWKRMWELLDPRDRGQSTPDNLEELESINTYLSCELKWVEVINNFGRVKVVYERKIADPNLVNLKPMFNDETEKWVLHEGEWYRDLK